MYRAMQKIAYFARVFGGIRLKRFQKALEGACRSSGKSKAALTADMVKCFFRFGAGFQDYCLFHFWELNDAQRDTYLTRFRSKKFIEFMNDPAYAHIIDKKTDFYSRFRDYLGRKTINLLDTDTTEADVRDFFDTHASFFCKMDALGCGEGAELLHKEDFADSHAFYQYIKSKGLATLEEVIENHPNIAEIYPNSVNTCRVVTVLDRQCEAHIVTAIFKFGRDGRFVDNNGVWLPIDLETGAYTYISRAGDELLQEYYTEHPNTHYPFSGFKVPMFKELCDMAKKAATVVPQVRYIGWDIAVTPHGPTIIEGNDYNDHYFGQMPGQTEKGVGLLPTIRKYIPEFKW